MKFRLSGRWLWASVSTAVLVATLVMVPSVRSVADTWSQGFLRANDGSLTVKCITASPQCSGSVVGDTFEAGFLRDATTGALDINCPATCLPATPTFSGLTISGTGTGSSAPVMKIQSTGTVPQGSSLAVGKWKTLLNSEQLVSFNMGTAGAQATPGGFLSFDVVQDGGVGLANATLTMDQAGHMSCVYDCLSTTTTSPASCTALTACSTVTITFSQPFVDVNGTAQAPYCTPPSIQDTTTATDIWIGNINAVSSTSVTYQYTPTTTTSGAKSLTVNANCFDSNWPT